MDNHYRKSDTSGVENDQFYCMQLQNNDPKGLERIYQKYSPELFSLGMSIIQDEDLITDCIQDVFVNLWKYRSSLDKVEQLKLYLFKCLNNRIYKSIKVANKNQKQKDQVKAETIMFADTIENKLILDQVEQEKSAKLLQSMKKLTPRQREVVRLFFFDNLTYEQISEIMGMNVQSVYTLAWKAVSRLKKNMLGSIFLLLFSF